ncbi:MAG TPA: hypothetical protein VD866_03335 [Urbifossiella sp.]|nr:hypothetical protein [Urbifossiella sp.]
MTEADWNSSGDPGQLLKHIEKQSPSGTPYRKLALLLAACVDQCDDSAAFNATAVELASHWADGNAVTVPEWEHVSELGRRAQPVPTAATFLEAVRYLAAHRASGLRWSMLRYVRSSVGWLRSGKARIVARCHLIRDIFGNPFAPVAFDPSWRTEAVVGLSRGMYEARDFAPMPVLADALEDAGCAHPDVLAHCRGGPHVRGCWVVDLVLGKA